MFLVCVHLGVSCLGEIFDEPLCPRPLEREAFMQGGAGGVHFCEAGYVGPV